MANRKQVLATNEFFHVYNRGNSKQIIFKDKTDYRRFEQLLFLCNSTTSVSIKDAKKRLDGVYSATRGNQLVAIGAYCLMPNHFHLLATPLVDDGISLFMKKLATGYVMYFNKKYERTGGLFEGTYKAKYADSDPYLKYLFSYIHLNPVRKNTSLVPRLDLGTAMRYPYSSLRDYFEITRDEGIIIDSEYFPEYFNSIKDHEVELLEWLDYEEIE